MIQIILIFVLIFLNAIFAASEVAIIAANDLQVENDALKGNKRAKRIDKFIKNPTNFLSAIQVGITLIGFLNGYLAAGMFSEPLAVFTQKFIKVDLTVLVPIMTFIVTIILAYFQVVFGELVPKRLGMKYPEKIAYGTSFVLVLVSKILKPFVWLLQVSADGIGKVFGVDPNESDEKMTEEEIRMIISTSGKKGVIDKQESQMIENILDFDETIVEDVMKHRTEISAIDINASRQEVIEMAKTDKYTRYPVYEDNIDQIIGILHVKDLLRFIDNNVEFNLKKLIREPFFVTKSKKINNLLNEMNSSQNHIAIVIDEYGGTAGIVTIEDLLEEIVGEIFDEYDDYEEEIKEITEHVYIVDGLTDIEDVEETINANLPIDDYDTISGFILGKLGRFPSKDEKVELVYNNYKFEILGFEDRVITEVKITELEIEEEKEEEQI